MGRASGAVLFLCAAGAFFLPLGLRQWRGEDIVRPGEPPKASATADGIGGAWGRAIAAQMAPASSVPAGSVAPAGGVELERSPTGGSDVAELDFELVPGKPGPVVPAPATWLESEPAREELQPATPWEGLPFGDLQQLLFKLLAATAVVLGLCVMLLRWGNRFLVGAGARGAGRELELADSIAVSREAGVKLIRIGNQRVVVGHDRGGLRGMVLLPTSFDDVLSEVRGEGGTDRRATELRGSVQATLRKPEDNGWDLTQPIS